MFRLRYAQRAFHVASVLLRNLWEISRERLLGRRGISGPLRLRMLLEELGGAFLKFGQILSLQVDSLPRKYCDALLNLLDRVPPFEREEIRRIFYEEFEIPAEELYLKFDYVPIASASIGQVHRATLKDGTAVAVKVQRPGVRELFHRDGALLRALVRLVFFLRIRSLYFLRDPVREFNEWLEDELDYRREAAYGEALRRNAEGTPAEKIPKIYWDLTSSRVLTMDFLEGMSVMQYLRVVERQDEYHLKELRDLGFVPSQFVTNVINNFMSDAFRHGLFHADLHPANLLILRDNRVGYVDFGIVGHLTPEARRKQIQLSMAYARGKTEEIFEAFLTVCTFSRDVDIDGFHRELERRCHNWYREPAIGGVPQMQRSLTVAMVDLLSLSRNYGLMVDREMIKYIRSLFLVDGLVALLAPGLDLTPHIRKVCEEFLVRDAQNKILSRGTVIGFLADISGWLSAEPAQMLRAIELIERKQYRSRTLDRNGSNSRDQTRTLAFAVGTVWASLAVVIWNSWRTPGLPSGFYLLIAFWGGWTLWLGTLLRRLAKP